MLRAQDYGNQHRTILRLLAAIILVQTIYWLGVSPLLKGTSGPPPERAEILSAEVATPESLKDLSSDTLVFRKIDLPHTVCCDPTYTILNLDFTPPAYGSAGLGIISDHAVDNYRLYLNGTIVDARGRMEMGDQTFDGGSRRLVHLPAGLVKQGINTLTYHTVRESIPYTDLRPPIVAEYTALSAWSAKRLWVLNDYRQLTALCAAIVGLIALLLLWRSDEKSYAAWMLLLSFAWTAQVLYSFLGLDLPGGTPARQFYYFSVTALVPIATFGFVDSWTGRPKPKLLIALIAGWIAIVAYCIVRLRFTAMPDGYDAADVALSAFMLIVSIAVGLRIVWHFLRQRDERVAEMAILSLCVAAIAADALSELSRSVPGGNMRYVTPLFLVAMAIAFINRNFRLFRSAESLNAFLKSELAEREAEVAASLEREREHIRLGALNDERQRLVADLHDGLGGQLMSLLAAARRGRLSDESIESGLQAGIDDMHLIVHSMETTSNSLAEGLEKFRLRVTPRLEQAGFVLKWNESVSGDLPEMRPREILSLLRILQEAVSKVLSV